MSKKNRINNLDDIPPGFEGLLTDVVNRLNMALGGIATVKEPSLPALHLATATGRETGVALCGEQLTPDAEGSNVKGLDFADHPDRCPVCYERLIQLANKAFDTARGGKLQ